MNQDITFHVPPKHVMPSVFHTLFQILHRVYEALVKGISATVRGKGILPDMQEHSKCAAAVQRCLKHSKTKPEASYGLLYSIILKFLHTLLIMALEMRRNCGVTALQGLLATAFLNQLQAAHLFDTWTVLLWACSNVNTGTLGPQISSVDLCLAYFNFKKISHSDGLACGA